MSAIEVVPPNDTRHLSRNQLMRGHPDKWSQPLTHAGHHFKWVRLQFSLEGWEGWVPSRFVMTNVPLKIIARKNNVHPTNIFQVKSTLQRLCVFLIGNTYAFFTMNCKILWINVVWSKYNNSVVKFDTIYYGQGRELNQVAPNTY